MFKSARIKLTLWYLVIIMAVSGFFSFIVYRGFVKELGRGFRYQAMQPPPERRLFIQNYGGYTRILPFVIYPEEIPPDEFLEIVNLAKRRFALQLLIINGGILVLAGTAGYFLAGKTLYPIEVMVDEQKRFVADASHGLRTPLTSMKTEVEVALRDKELRLKDAKGLLKSNLDEVNKMKYFSDSLLKLSRYESNGRDLGMESVDLSEAVKQAIERNLAQAKSRKIKIKEDLAQVVVKGNPQSLVELVSILINNAVKYSPAKSEIVVNLRKESRRPGGPFPNRRFFQTGGLARRAVLEVEDKGIGIAKEDIPHIFDRFYRSDSSRCKGKVDGYGLGLSIAKSIVAMHKGEIRVDSKVGRGSKFKVILPM